MTTEAKTLPVLRTEAIKITIGGRVILGPVSLPMPKGEILAIIGPAGSGKSSFLKVLNRMTDFEEAMTLEGRAHFHGQDLAAVDVVELRRRVGLVFPVPTPLPMSIFENLAFGLRLMGLRDHSELMQRAETSLQAAYLWEEVKDRLSMPANNLSGGQQQRLCLARTLMLKPDALLLDEPCSGLDPISTAKIEEALTELKREMAVVLVTNNVKQASRVSDHTAFLLMGELVEFAPTQTLFTTPSDRRTEDYVTGRFG